MALRITFNDVIMNERCLFGILHYLDMTDILQLAMATNHESIKKFYMNYLVMTPYTVVGKILSEIIKQIKNKVHEDEYIGCADELDFLVPSDTRRVISDLQLFEKRKCEINLSYRDEKDTIFDPIIFALLAQNAIFKQTKWNIVTILYEHGGPNWDTKFIDMYHNFPTVYEPIKLCAYLDGIPIDITKTIQNHKSDSYIKVIITISWNGEYTMTYNLHDGLIFLQLLNSCDFNVSGIRAKHHILDTLIFRSNTSGKQFDIPCTTSYFYI